jgi:aromatic ring-opening dioxygenase catalytic subunit (LigB family)
VDKAVINFWKSLGEAFPHVPAIIILSAHWYTADNEVCISTSNEILYDFGEIYPGIFNETYKNVPIVSQAWVANAKGLQ